MQKDNVEKQNYDAPRVECIAIDEQSFLATSPPNFGASVGDFGDGGTEDLDGDSYDADGNPLDGNNP